MGDLSTWRGIPFAAAPVGPLRLRAPHPVQPWAGVRDATRVRQRRPPVPNGHDAATGQVPADLRGLPDAQHRRARRTECGAPAVMVFVHGGAFVLGTPRWASTGATAWRAAAMSSYVSLNYRLGALGYPTSPSSRRPSVPSTPTSVSATRSPRCSDPAQHRGRRR
ncbi:carboxylesterase family protein [Rhodococcus hoagii]|nr:carboxylesterase family protein [Prescottella equi]